MRLALAALAFLTACSSPPPQCPTCAVCVECPPLASICDSWKRIPVTDKQRDTLSIEPDFVEMLAAIDEHNAVCP